LHAHELDAAFAEMDALAQVLLGRGLDGRHGLRQLVWRPEVPELRETEAAFVWRAEMPGLDAADVEVTVDDGVLSVSLRHAASSAPEGFTWRHRERQGAGVSRRWRLPALVDADAIEASLVDGVFSLTLPKRAAPTARRIPVTING
jgi:HSP20 family protein